VYAEADDPLSMPDSVTHPKRAGQQPLYLPFELDRHRILSCTAFRRVRSKTQVFGSAEHDHYRTRLTHMLEVADIARVLARGLCANETLAETIALAHDLGHSPFGHAGEIALNQLMAGWGGFEHNVHSLRVMDYLEHPFPQFRGLNLTYEVREGLIKHDTKFDTPQVDRSDPTITMLFEQGPGPAVESQIVDVADRLAYDLHDLEDAIGAGFVDLGMLADVKLWQEALAKWCNPTARLGQESATGSCADVQNIHAIRRPVLDAMLNRLLTDVIDTSRTRLQNHATPNDVRRTLHTCVELSDVLVRQLEALEALLMEQVYRRPEVARIDENAQRTISDLFAAYRSHPEKLPQRFRSRVTQQSLERVICDYIAGMTDRFCWAEHQRLVG